MGSWRCAVLESYRDVIIRVAGGLVRFAEPLLIMAALFSAQITAKEISAVALSPIRHHSGLQQKLTWRYRNVEAGRKLITTVPRNAAAVR
jgi:hypothetical protein